MKFSVELYTTQKILDKNRYTRCYNDANIGQKLFKKKTLNKS